MNIFNLIRRTIMKRLGRFLIVAAIMTMVFAMPVLADENKDRTSTMISSESTDDLVRQLDDYNRRVMGQVLYVGAYNNYAAPNGIHANMVSKQVKDYDILCCNNHMLYLNNVLGAAQTDLVNKQNQYNSAASQAATNPTFAAMLPVCESELKAAQAKVVDAQNKIALANAKLAKYYAANVY